MCHRACKCLLVWWGAGRYREYTYHVEGRRTVTLGNYLMVVPPHSPMTETERLERVEKYRSVCDSLLKENEYRRLGEWNF